MRKAFTLVELMTVVAIMALLGVASVGGYSAMQRGMRERGAVASVSALLRAAKERAAVDRVPTAVFCYNIMLRDTNAEADENAIVVGVATAVRRSGRITSVNGKLLYDEFADLHLTYNALSDDEEFSTDGQSHSKSELDKSGSMKLFKFPLSQSMEYSLVADSVWCSDKNDIFLFSGTSRGGSTNMVMSAFYKKNGSQHEASWKIGDAYAFPIGEIQLPHGMVFGRSVPSSVSQISSPKVLIFDPEDDSDETIEINTAIPGANGLPEKYKRAGTATSDEKKRQ